ncbi:MAG TPA: copper resistance CopC family protein [Lapillicoccus sp.]|uniref:copper resistance CopC family protein n=1 Tax=Lapillicoccus sp. TaxID=1909287 RepID=UPI002F944A0C
MTTDRGPMTTDRNPLTTDRGPMKNDRNPLTTFRRRSARAVAVVLATVRTAVPAVLAAPALLVVLVVLVATVVTLIVSAGPASAHDVLRSTNPADGAVVDRLPDRVVLTFDEPALAIGTQVVVTGPAGTVSDGPPQLIDAEVRQPVRSGPAGRYTVLWRVTSADGHPVSGTFAFTTQQGTAASPTTTPSTTTSPSTSPQTTPTAQPTTTPTSVPPTSPAASPQTSGLSGPALGAILAGVIALLVLGWWAFRRRRAQRP